MGGVMKAIFFLFVSLSLFSNEAWENHIESEKEKMFAVEIEIIDSIRIMHNNKIRELQIVQARSWERKWDKNNKGFKFLGMIFILEDWKGFINNYQFESLARMYYVGVMARRDGNVYTNLDSLLFLYEIKRQGTHVIIYEPSGKMGLNKKKIIEFEIIK